MSRVVLTGCFIGLVLLCCGLSFPQTVDLPATDQWLISHIPTTTEFFEPKLGTSTSQQISASAKACIIRLNLNSYVHTFTGSSSDVGFNFYELVLHSASGRAFDVSSGNLPRSKIPNAFESGTSETLKINLSSIDLGHVEVTRVSSTDSNPLVESGLDRMTIFIPFGNDEELAERMARAFRNAIHLCGGKPDVF